MVSFQCDACQDVVKKPKLDQHMGRCGSSFTCIDCSTTFAGPAEYKSHTTCISEAEKYQKALYKAPRQDQQNGYDGGNPRQQNGRGGFRGRGRGGAQHGRSWGVPRSMASGANGTPLGTPVRMSPVDAEIPEEKPSPLAQSKGNPVNEQTFSNTQPHVPESGKTKKDKRNTSAASGPTTSAEIQTEPLPPKKRKRDDEREVSREDGSKEEKKKKKKHATEPSSDAGATAQPVPEASRENERASASVTQTTSEISSMPQPSKSEAIQKQKKKDKKKAAGGTQAASSAIASIPDVSETTSEEPKKKKQKGEKSKDTTPVIGTPAAATDNDSTKKKKKKNVDSTAIVDASASDKLPSKDAHKPSSDLANSKRKRKRDENFGASDTKENVELKKEKKKRRKSEA